MADGILITDSEERQNILKIIDAFKREINISSITPLRTGTLLEKLLGLSKTEIDSIQYLYADEIAGLKWLIAQLSQNTAFNLNFGCVDISELDAMFDKLSDYAAGALPSRMVVFSNKKVVGWLEILSDESGASLTQVFSTRLQLKDNYFIEAGDEVKTYVRTKKQFVAGINMLASLPGESDGSIPKWELLLDVATPEKDGLMSKEDKGKLNDIDPLNLLGVITLKEMSLFYEEESQILMEILDNITGDERLSENYRYLVIDQDNRNKVVGFTDFMVVKTQESQQEYVVQSFTSPLLWNNSEEKFYQEEVEDESAILNKASINSYYRLWKFDSRAGWKTTEAWKYLTTPSIKLSSLKSLDGIQMALPFNTIIPVEGSVAGSGKEGEIGFVIFTKVPDPTAADKAPAQCDILVTNCIIGETITDSPQISEGINIYYRIHTQQRVVGKPNGAWITFFTSDSAAKLNTLWTFYESFPATGNETYGVMNRNAEVIAGAGYEVMAGKAPTAMSLALNSLATGRLQVIPPVSEEMLEEVKDLIGEERWNELAAATATTLENKIVKSQAEVLAEALKAYDERKAQIAALKEMEQMAEADNMTVEDIEEDTKVPQIGRNDKLV